MKRHATWTAAHEQAVRALREQDLRMGKVPLHFLLRRQGIILSASIIGRILASMRRQLLRGGPAVRIHQARLLRPYATRVSKDKRQPTAPWALI